MLKIRYRHEAAVGSKMFVIEYVQFEFHYNNIQPSLLHLCLRIKYSHTPKCRQDFIKVYVVVSHIKFFYFQIFCLLNFMWHGKSVSSVDIKCSSYFLTIDKSCQMAMYVLVFLFTIRPYKINQIIREINFVYLPKYLLRQILSQLGVVAWHRRGEKSQLNDFECVLDGV